MKFLCSNCKAKYQISDDRVAGRTLRMTCRKCKEEIVIRGSPMPTEEQGAPEAHPPQPPPPASALSADWNARVAGGTASYAENRALDEWHIAINDTPVGPMRREEVARKMATGAVGPASLAWREGLDDWTPVQQIPELAILLPTGGRISGLPPAPPPAAHPAAPHQTPGSAAQRMETTPLGGRGGAGVFSPEEWSAPGPTPPGVGEGSHAGPHPVGPTPSSTAEDVPGLRGRTGGPPPVAIVFAVLAFALLMSVITIVGAGWLQSGGGKTAAATQQTQQPDPGEPSQAAPHIELDETDLESEETEDEAEEAEDEARSAGKAKRRKGGGADQGKKPANSEGKKKLSASQRAMLERMGGQGAEVADLETRDARDRRNKGRGGRGELTASQLSKVVARGKSNLQRCYETAARRGGTDDTVRMDIELRISPSGNVTRVRAKGRGLPGMANCIERTVRMWRFPSSRDGAETKFPIVFSPGG